MNNKKRIITLMLFPFFVGCSIITGNNQAGSMKLGKYFSTGDFHDHEYIDFINDSLYVHVVDYYDVNYIDTANWFKASKDSTIIYLDHFDALEYNDGVLDVRYHNGMRVFKLDNDRLCSGLESRDYIHSSVHR